MEASTSTGVGRDGRWVTLPYSAWGALLASQSPPQAVRTARPPSASSIRDTVTTGDVTTITHRAPTAEDLASVLDDMRDYLTDAGVTADPWLGAWEVWIRNDMSEAEWWARVLATQVSARPRDYVRLLREVLAQLVG